MSYTDIQQLRQDTLSSLNHAYPLVSSLTVMIISSRVPYHESMATPFPENDTGTQMLEAEGTARVKAIHRLIRNHVAADAKDAGGGGFYADLVEAEDPRIEAFWFRGGFEPDKRMKLKRRGLKKVRSGCFFKFDFGLILVT